MRTLRILPPMLIAMTCQATAQPTPSARTVAPPTTHDADRVPARPPRTVACGVWLEGCLGEDRDRILLFLGALGTAKQPLLAR
jgi:hypothetical protein